MGQTLGVSILPLIGTSDAHMYRASSLSEYATHMAEQVMLIQILLTIQKVRHLLLVSLRNFFVSRPIDFGLTTQVSARIFRRVVEVEHTQRSSAIREGFNSCFEFWRFLGSIERSTPSYRGTMTA